LPTANFVPSQETNWVFRTRQNFKGTPVQAKEQKVELKREASRRTGQIFLHVTVIEGSAGQSIMPDIGGYLLKDPEFCVM
jgi:hypothetical protein